MELNYLILAHKNLLQLDRLVKNLTSHNTNFFIHIDKKVPWEQIRKFDFNQNQKVQVVKDRYSIKWGGFNMVLATLTLMKSASSKSNNGYCILISGQDFLLKSNEFIYNFFSKNYGAEYMTYWSLPYQKWSSGGLNRIRYLWFVDKIGFKASRLLYLLQRIGKFKRTYSLDSPPFGGTQWWCLTSDCIRYILEFITSNPAFLNFYEHTLISDEMFFQTIVLNSSFKEHVVNDHLRYVKFDGLNVHPNLLGIKDLSGIIVSGNLWARKFDENYDSNIFEELERHINA